MSRRLAFGRKVFEMGEEKDILKLERLCTAADVLEGLMLDQQSAKLTHKTWV